MKLMAKLMVGVDGNGEPMRRHKNALQMHRNIPERMSFGCVAMLPRC